jgi:OPA family glycerol-3-phosphate transporter-like MFS transporter
MTNVFHQEEYKKAVVKVSWGSSLGTIVVYLFSPLIISVFDWKAVFYVSGICGLVALLFWIFCTNLSGESDDGVEKVDIPKMSMSATLKMLFTPLMICVMIAIISQGMVRDGVTTWMPTYIDATYNLGSKISILSGVLLPIFSVLTFTFASILYRKKFTNPMTCAGLFFSVGILSCLMLVIFTGKSAFLSIFCSAVLTGSMHAVNLILICMLPAFFKKYGNVSTASGVLNACTYIGSALSTFGISYIAKNIGWDKALIAWLAVVVLGTLMCLISIKPWAIKYPNSEDQ